MTATTVTTVGSKPTAIAALRATWRKEAAHLVEQVQRFLRLTVLAALPSLVDVLSGGKFDTKTLLAFILPFAEVAYRQMFPALGAKGADQAQGVTIVPEQVGLPAEVSLDDDGLPPVTEAPVQTDNGLRGEDPGVAEPQDPNYVPASVDVDPDTEEVEG